MENIKELIAKLYETSQLSKEEWMTLLQNPQKAAECGLFEKARQVRQQHYGHDVYIRGLIEFTNYCKNDCFYCGIRKSNAHAVRYRLTKEEILDCCHMGYEAGFCTFVLQGGEDEAFTEKEMLDIITSIKEAFPQCALTLSIGEKSHASYQAFFDAGVDRYLLRHETYNTQHYCQLHPKALTAKKRQKCLWDLKEIGYQVGAGFMVGSPFQTPEHLAEDMLFLKELNPHMVGIGPFIPHKDTPFRSQPQGSLEFTLFMLALVRLMLPKVLLPATTALGSIAEDGRERGILAGANVVMPNLSPIAVRKNYALYNHKLCTGGEAAEGKLALEQQMESIGYHVVISRGDSLNI